MQILGEGGRADRLLGKDGRREERGARKQRGSDAKDEMGREERILGLVQEGIGLRLEQRREGTERGGTGTETKKRREGRSGKKETRSARRIASVRSTRWRVLVQEKGVEIEIEVKDKTYLEVFHIETRGRGR